MRRKLNYENWEKIWGLQEKSEIFLKSACNSHSLNSFCTFFLIYQFVLNYCAVSEDKVYRKVPYLEK